MLVRKVRSPDANFRPCPAPLQSRHRPAGAHTIIELGASAFCIMIMALLCANVSVLVMAANINDRACRDATRAAAQTGDYSNAVRAAQASLKAHRTDGYFVNQPTMAGDLIYEDYGGAPNPVNPPFVSVTTTTTARIPAPILFFGANFGDGGTMTFSRTYTFPIVKVTLSL